MAQRRSPISGISIIARHGEATFTEDGETLLYRVRSDRYDLDVTYTGSEDTAQRWCRKAKSKHSYSPYRHTDLVASVCPFPSEGATAATAVCVIGAPNVLIYRGELPQCVHEMLLEAFIRPLWIQDILALVAPEGAAHQLLGAAAPGIGAAAPVIGADDLAMGVGELAVAEDAVTLIGEAEAGVEAGVDAVIGVAEAAAEVEAGAVAVIGEDEAGVEAGADAVMGEAQAVAGVEAGAVFGGADPGMAVVMQAEAPPIHVIFKAVQRRAAVMVPQRYFNWDGQARDELAIMYAAHLAFMMSLIGDDFLVRGWI